MSSEEGSEAERATTSRRKAARGRGRPRQYLEGQDARTKRIRLTNEVHDRWQAFKRRERFTSDSQLANHLLIVAEETIMQPTTVDARLRTVPLESTPPCPLRTRPCMRDLSPSITRRHREIAPINISDTSLLSRSFIPTNPGTPYGDIDSESDSSDEDYDPFQSLQVALTVLWESDEVESDDDSTDESDTSDTETSSDEHSDRNHAKLKTLASQASTSQGFSVTATPLQMVQCPKVIVAVPQLLQLVPRTCLQPGCSEPLTTTPTFLGCSVVLTMVCPQDHSFSWCSSSRHLNSIGIPICASNLLLAGSILFSGNAFHKIDQLFHFLGLKCISEASFYRYQSMYLFPVIETTWNEHAAEVLSQHQGKDLVLCGDGRCDSPGSSAKFCTYILMETETNKIIHCITVAKSEVVFKSPNMEREGLRRSLRSLSSKISIAELATDASISIIKMLSDDFPSIFHSLDVWHKAKKMRKSLSEAGKARGMGKLVMWSDKIVNHFWYCCLSAQGNADTLKVKWVSVLHHVTDEHEWITGQCDHTALTEEPTLPDGNRIPYFDKGEPAFEALQTIIMDQRWLASLKFYVRFRHTGILECFHNLLLTYAPKRLGYDRSYHYRVLLGALDHNHHLDRECLSTATGELHYHRKYRKRTKNWDVASVKQQKKYPHIPRILLSVLDYRAKSSEALRSHRAGKRRAGTTPDLPPLSGEIASRKQSRFQPTP